MAKKSSSSSSDAFTIAPFTFSIEEPRNRLIKFENLSEIKIRPNFSMATLQANGGISAGDVQIPNAPGHRITIDPPELTVVVEDAMNDERNKPVLAQFNLLGERNAALGPGTNRKWGPDKTIKRKKTIHEMKTLLREFAKIHEVERQDPDERESPQFMKLVVEKGEVPSVEEVDDQPGRYLYDPRGKSKSQPAYEDMYEEFIDKLTFSRNG